MTVRILITGAGSGASNNLIRDLRTGDATLVIVGGHHDRFVLKKSPVERNYLLPPPWRDDFGRALERVVKAEGIDLVIPTTDLDVAAIARLRRRLPGRMLLPSPRVIALCADKYALNAVLRARAVPVPRTYPVTSPTGIGEIFRRLGHPARAWCRIRTGNGSMGALPVANADQAKHWIGYWRQMRDVRPAAFTISEYLPGRDFFGQGLWTKGTLVLLKTCERLSYFGGGGQPSGTSSVSALARTVVDRRVAAVCEEAVRAMGRRLSGTFNFDLKENAAGVPCITEINAGRFASGTGLLDLTGRHNMALTYVKVALGEPVEIRDPYDAVEGYYSVRDLDTVPSVVHADELFDGIEDARA
jgi:carbamoylphosphate synthase large subunit